MITCLNHSDRETEARHCAAALRDRKNLEHAFCVCCDECRAECLSHDPHNHGGSIEDEWDRNDSSSLTGIRCKVCGMEML